MATAEQANAVKAEARIDAACFVDEFGEALDPAATDWDATAFDGVASKLDLGAERDALWPVYQTELVAATRCLADGHEMLADHNLT